jgi:cytochrome bd ubiquinol oxidase subunit II
VEGVWFAIVTMMLAVYAVLDGFDFGVGALHRLVARTDGERRTVFAAIGPFWDGNEVWLVAAGGVLFMTFPRLYSAAFSGFYMPLMIVLWLLIFRGVSIEFRSHAEDPLVREFWDTVFAVSSSLLAVVLGASLGNVVRGVPAEATNEFAMHLFTDFLPGKRPGVFDWYTTLAGLFSLLVLAGHGALFLVWKTTGPVHLRARDLARTAWTAVLVCWPLLTLFTALIRPELFTVLIARPWSWCLALPTLGGLAGVFRYLGLGRERAAFLSSCAFLLGLLATAMAGSYPVWLRSTLDRAHDLTSTNTASGSYALRAGLAWFVVGVSLAAAYFVLVFRIFRGKVALDEEGHSQ